MSSIDAILLICEKILSEWLVCHMYLLYVHAQLHIEAIIHTGIEIKEWHRFQTSVVSNLSGRCPRSRRQQEDSRHKFRPVYSQLRCVKC